MEGVRADRYEGECYLASHGVRHAPAVDQWRPGLLEQLVHNVPLAAQLTAMRQFINDPRDTGTADGTVHLLAHLFRGDLLSPSSTAFLRTALEATSTGPNRLKGLLPPGTVVAHKTGTTGSVLKLNGSTNDVGVVTLPHNAGQLALAVYVSGSAQDIAAREEIIARIARATYDQFFF